MSKDRMKHDPRRAAMVLDLQMRSKPVRNEAVLARAGAEGKLELKVPLADSRLGSVLRLVLPLSREKNVELDRLGTEIYGLCDGKHTVEEIIDWHRERWMLSFFEARGMIFEYLRRLMRRNLIVLVVPRSPRE